MNLKNRVLLGVNVDHIATLREARGTRSFLSILIPALVPLQKLANCSLENHWQSTKSS